MAGSTTVISHNSTSSTCSLVSFRLGGQLYALSLEQVVQIIPMVTITRLPQLQDSTLGVINVRGTVVPVVDLRARFGLPEAPIQLYTPIILATVNGHTVGLVVDDVADVLTVPNEQIIRLEQVLPQELGTAPVLQGVVQHEGSMIPLIASEQLFMPEQAAAIAEAVRHLTQASQEVGNGADDNGADDNGADDSGADEKDATGSIPAVIFPLQADEAQPAAPKKTDGRRKTSKGKRAALKEHSVPREQTNARNKPGEATLSGEKAAAAQQTSPEDTHAPRKKTAQSADTETDAASETKKPWRGGMLG